MTRANLNGINAAIAHRQIEMVRGHGYFYFMPTADAPLDLPEIDSVYTAHITALSKQQWVDHVEGYFETTA